MAGWLDFGENLTNLELGNEGCNTWRQLQCSARRVFGGGGAPPALHSSQVLSSDPSSLPRGLRACSGCSRPTAQDHLTSQSPVDPSSRDQGSVMLAPAARFCFILGLPSRFAYGALAPGPRGAPFAPIAPTSYGIGYHGRTRHRVQSSRYSYTSTVAFPQAWAGTSACS